MTTSQKTTELVQLFAALADPTRLRILKLMQDREVCVCDFVATLGQSQPKISRHLAYLRKAGVVTARREGTWMHYRMTTFTDASSQRILDAALTAVAQNSDFGCDLSQMRQVNCESSEVPPC